MSANDAAMDAADAAVDARVVRVDSGPECEMTCGLTEHCCLVGGEPQCIDTSEDPENCGGCNVLCAEGRGTSCQRSRCVCGAVDIGCRGDRNSWCCPPRGDMLMNYCANFDQDGADCGECGLACNPRISDRCDGGRCRCGDLRTPCVGTPDSICCPGRVTSSCVDTTSDPNNCGACGRRCQLIERCMASQCTRGAEECTERCGDGDVCCNGTCCAQDACNGRECAMAELDGGASDGGAPDGGATDSGVPDSGLPDSGGDSGSADADGGS